MQNPLVVFLQLFSRGMADPGTLQLHGTIGVNDHQLKNLSNFLLWYANDPVLNNGTLPDVFGALHALAEECCSDVVFNILRGVLHPVSQDTFREFKNPLLHQDNRGLHESKWFYSRGVQGHYP